MSDEFRTRDGRDGPPRRRRVRRGRNDRQARAGRLRGVTYVIVTNGNKGSNDPSRDPERLAETRVAEQRRAARTLGVERVEFLGYPDGEVEDARALRCDVARRSGAGDPTS